MSRFLNYIQQLTEGIQDKAILKSVKMVGHPGSGKSFTIDRITDGAISPKLVNTDKVFEYYMKLDNYDTWEKYGNRVKSITKEQLTHYLNGMLPLFVDGTSSNPNAVLRRRGILQSIGYDTALIFVNCSLETALERNRKRERKVDEDFLKNAYEKVENLKPYYKSQFPLFYEVYNDIGELTDDVILQAYRQVSGFFNSPIENPIGQELKEEMLNQGYKYLFEHPDFDKQYIKKLVDSWYRR